MNFVKHALWLNENNWDITIFCVENSPIHNKVKQLNVKSVFVNKNKKYYDIINAFKVYKKVKELKIDAIWIRDVKDMSLVGLVKTFSCNKIKIIYQQAMQLGIKKRDILHTIRFSKIDAWITPLNFLANQVKEMTKFNSSKIHVIPLAIDLSKLNLSVISKEESRKTLELDLNKFYIGILGRLDPQKGQDFLINAINNLKNRGLDINLLIVGESTKNEGIDYEETLKKLISDLKIKENVIIMPYTDKINLFYNAIDLFAMASKGETFGMVTIEALIYGIPIIGTNTSGTPEILKNGEYGTLYNEGNVNDFCEKIIEIYNNYNLYNNKSKTAQSFAVEEYSHINEINKIEKVLNSLELYKN